MKLYLSPPIWMGLGFLTGGLHFKPGIAIALVWAVAHLGMLTWIMRDVLASRAPADGTETTTEDIET